MPFRSKSQIGACYKRGDRRWDCDKWLKETPSVCCLPYKKGGRVKTRCLRKGERIRGPIQVGSRGGRFFTVTEKDSNGTICTVKIYLPKKR